MEDVSRDRVSQSESRYNYVMKEITESRLKNWRHFRFFYIIRIFGVVRYILYIIRISRNTAVPHLFMTTWNSTILWRFSLGRKERLLSLWPIALRAALTRMLSSTGCTGLKEYRFLKNQAMYSTGQIGLCILKI